MTAADVRNVTVQAIRLLLSGNLHAREASALAQLCNSLYRIIPTADLEARVTILEEQVVQEESGNSPDLDPTGSPTDGPETVETGARQRSSSTLRARLTTTHLQARTTRAEPEHQRWIGRSRGGIAVDDRAEPANFAVSVA